MDYLISDKEQITIYSDGGWEDGLIFPVSQDEDKPYPYQVIFRCSECDCSQWDDEKDFLYCTRTGSITDDEDFCSRYCLGEKNISRVVGRDINGINVLEGDFIYHNGIKDNIRVTKDTDLMTIQGVKLSNYHLRANNFLRFYAGDFKTIDNVREEYNAHALGNPTPHDLSKYENAISNFVMTKDYTTQPFDEWLLKIYVPCFDKPESLDTIPYIIREGA